MTKDELMDLIRRWAQDPDAGGLGALEKRLWPLIELALAEARAEGAKEERGNGDTQKERDALRTENDNLRREIAEARAVIGDLLDAVEADEIPNLAPIARAWLERTKEV